MIIEHFIKHVKMLIRIDIILKLPNKILKYVYIKESNIKVKYQLCSKDYSKSKYL